MTPMNWKDNELERLLKGKNKMNEKNNKKLLFTI